MSAITAVRVLIWIITILSGSFCFYLGWSLENLTVGQDKLFNLFGLITLIGFASIAGVRVGTVLYSRIK